MNYTKIKIGQKIPWDGTDEGLAKIKEVMQEDNNNIEKTLLERGNKYGPFSGHALITQDLKATMQLCPKWENLTASQKEALEMIAHKIGRILNGDPNYADSWHDIAGYSTLIEKQLESKKPQMQYTNLGE